MSTSRGAARERLVAGLGVAAVAVSLGGIFTAVALAPWFSFFGDALSNLGELGRPTAPVFNGALLVGGALGAGFVVAVWSRTDDGLRGAALAVLLLAVVFMALTGAFPLPDPLHFAVAPLFFLLLTLGLFVWGAGDYAAGRPARGGAFVVAAVLHVVSWVWWLLLGWPGPGVAVPELVGSLSLAAWTLWLSVDAYRASRLDRPRL
jgi:hypothetical membrane protein